ncbi:glycolate oxidase subunit GlcE [Janthinobacterium agaricidamnosum]|uniref:FAD binding domain protein n=1 Tax=Janthinobacterium agaricidamnosum NBRC 102515 = DSM 9628 TaxID=1349767 RepID=W0VCQ8_9BURK|nr:glycolate oxidase subunit GlcE [Janthinobacterium agaricidamnosum]CDG85158.1 FAD binding domain protein [Janthinobacterium agaricidamnosum NBRC 102515 = DSM 9628]
MQEITEQFRQRILAASANRTALRLRGGGSKDWYGQSFDGELLDTRPYAGIVDYEPTELVITARCGTPLAGIEAALAAQHQMLAFEAPHFGSGTTVGGMLASGLSGPRRASAGALRDFVLGAKLMDGKGEVLTFGGQVMKNVAGYDVSRLLAGSLGTLGLILDVSLKVLPLPLRETSVRFALGEIEALRYLNQWAGRPLPISASCWYDGLLTVRLSGADAAVASALGSIGGQEIKDGAAFWASLREQTHPFFSGETSVWRLSLPSAASAVILRGQQLIEWGGAQRWLKIDADMDMARTIRRTVAAAGGHASLFRGGDKSVGVFHPLAPAVEKIHQRLKQAFDPAGIFNPGRMY